MKEKIDWILRKGTLISTAALVGSVLLQIFARFFLEKTPPWTEESSRLFFIYATAFAAGLAFRDGYYVHLDVFFNKLSKKTQDIVCVAIAGSIALLFLLLGMYSVKFISAGVLEKSPSMHISMSFAFGSMFVLGLGITYYAVLDLWKTIKNLKA